MCAEYGGFIETLAGAYTISEGGTCHIAALHALIQHLADIGGSFFFGAGSVAANANTVALSN
jgi:hypothetical protein